MDKYCIDTSSLICLARYFDPFDKDVVDGFLLKNFQSQRFVLLESVFRELERVSGGLVLKNHPFLKEKSTVPRIKDITAKKNHHTKLDESWVISKQKAELDENEISTQKAEYMKGADFQIIAFCMEDKSARVAISEETPYPNDNKLFKKIPKICEEEGITHENLVWLLKKLDFSVTYNFNLRPVP